MIVIADSSPLIALAVIEKLELLEKLYENVYVPTAVLQEVVRTDKPFANDLKLLKSRVIIYVGDVAA